MDIVVVHEIEKFLFRPNIKKRASFNAIILLNQLGLVFKKRGTDLACKLCHTYIVIFIQIFEEYSCS
jgi:hypothetical protein